jgi:hypothetical protein
MMLTKRLIKITTKRKELMSTKIVWEVEREEFMCDFRK